MRPLTIVGLLLLAGGLFIGIRGLSYQSERSVLRVGEFEATVEQQRAVPPWVGWAGAALGLGLIVAGVRQRRDS